MAASPTENRVPRTLVLIGAGSTFFTRGIVQDLIARGGEWELRLADISPEGLDDARRLAQRYIDAAEAHITVKAALDHRQLLPGADAVITTIGVGGRAAWKIDVLLPRRFGIYQWTGDTYGPGGVSRALRMVPVMIDIARDIAAQCPQAIFINVANPLSVIGRAIWRQTPARPIGLCGGTRGTHAKLARLIDVPPDQLEFKAIGVNHFTWVLSLRSNGEDAWPKIRQRVRPSDDRLSWELFDTFGGFPCVGDFHFAEFLPAWQRKGAYYGQTIGMVEWGDSEKWMAYIDQLHGQMVDEAHGRLPLQSGHATGDDQLIQILDAMWNDNPDDYAVNLPNDGQVANLPLGAMLEGTTRVSGAGLRPHVFDHIPTGIAAVLAPIIAVQELTIDATLSGDRKMVVQALIAGGHVHTNQEAGALADALLDAQRRWLPRFFA